jgi:hypothetical protein
MNRRINHAIYIIITIELHRTIKQLHIKQLLYEIIIQLDLSAWYHYMHLDLSAWDHCASRCIWIDHMQETGLTSLHKLLIINMPYFLYQDLIIMHTHMFIRTRRFNTINQASVLLYFSLILIYSKPNWTYPSYSIKRKKDQSILFNYYQPSSSLPTCAASLAHNSVYSLEILYSSSSIPITYRARSS